MGASDPNEKRCNVESWYELRLSGGPNAVVLHFD